MQKVHKGREKDVLVGKDLDEDLYGPELPPCGLGDIIKGNRADPGPDALRGCFHHCLRSEEDWTL